MENTNFIWCEKYRPKTIDECILPKDLKETFKNFISEGQLPNFLFCGSAGVGKTTVAKALCNEIGAEYLFINGSEESGIDTLRTKIRGFASTVSLTDARKIVIIDEADYLNCLHEEESVLLSDGSTIKLKDMTSDAYSVLSFNKDTNTFEPDTAYVVNREESEVFEVELSNGSKVVVTEDHPFMVVDVNGNISQRSIADNLEGYEIILK